eukprot:TRINITY_DN22360_c0_g1_i1.p1 TRINITY_DN22360_c0_g1~~TRINITY_DN22360_c0_g1_i1.p1  ORF type:complete len:996 (+),score=187.28 TRINITY_DN22360_c0_g1_i1:40-3027(+)
MTVTSPRSGTSPRSVTSTRGETSPRSTLQSPRGTIRAHTADEAKQLLLQRAVAEAPSVMRAFYRLEVRLEAERQQAEKQLQSLETRLLQATLKPAPVAGRWEEMQGHLDALTEMVQTLSRRLDSVEVTRCRSAEPAENIDGTAIARRLDVMNKAVASQAATLLEGQQCQQYAEQHLRAELHGITDRVQMVEEILHSSFKLVDKAACSVAEQLGQLWPVAEEVDEKGGEGAAGVLLRGLDKRVACLEAAVRSATSQTKAALGPPEVREHHSGTRQHLEMSDIELQMQRESIETDGLHDDCSELPAADCKPQLTGQCRKQASTTCSEDIEVQAQIRTRAVEPVTACGILRIPQTQNGLRSVSANAVERNARIAAVASSSTSYGDSQSDLSDLVTTKQDNFQSMLDELAQGMDCMRTQLQSFSDALADLRICVTEKLSESHLQERLQPLVDRLAEVTEHLPPVPDENVKLRGTESEIPTATKEPMRLNARVTPCQSENGESQLCGSACKLALAKEEAMKLVSDAVLRGQLQVLSGELTDLKLHAAQALPRGELESRFQIWSDEQAAEQAYVAEALAQLKDQTAKLVSAEDLKSQFHIWLAEVESHTWRAIPTEPTVDVQSQSRLPSDESAGLQHDPNSNASSGKDVRDQVQCLLEEMAQLKTHVAESASKVDLQTQFQTLADELTQLKVSVAKASSALEAHRRLSEELEQLKRQTQDPASIVEVKSQLQLLSNELEQLRCQPHSRPHESAQLQSAECQDLARSIKATELTASAAMTGINRHGTKATAATELTESAVSGPTRKEHVLIDSQFQVFLDELAQLKRDAVESASKSDVQGQLQALSAELAQVTEGQLQAFSDELAQVKAAAEAATREEEERTQLRALADELAQLKQETAGSASSQDIQSQLQSLSEEVAQWKITALESAPGEDMQSQVQVLLVELDQLKAASASRDDVDAQLQALAEVRRQLQALSTEVEQLKVNATDLELAPRPKKCCSFR